MKGYELKLNVDTSSKPFAQPVRKIPFGVREKVEKNFFIFISIFFFVEKNLDELLACGIIEEVPEGPTSWVFPLVVVNTPDGDVTIYVDMRRANQAIIGERQPIPRVS